MYITDCLDSITRQTYTDYEVIIVDDGSTDDSGFICEAFAKKNSRFIVVHQANSGLSAARNTGIRLARGGYICFLDSDDEFGTESMLQEYMSILQLNENIDLLQFPTMWYYGDDNMNLLGVYDEIVIGEPCVLAKFRNQTITGTAWDKIYKKEIFNYAVFPIGRYYEDGWFMADIIPHCQNVICSSKGFYKYKIRSNSITTGTMSVKKCKDNIETMFKNLVLIQSMKDDYIQYLVSYISIINQLTSYVLAYDISPFDSNLFLIQSKCPPICSLLFEMREILSNPGILKRNVLKLILIRLFGLKALLKTVLYKCNLSK
jgi:glycosyltransferase involved in cell wall biosynthesis